LPTSSSSFLGRRSSINRPVKIPLQRGRMDRSPEEQSSWRGNTGVLECWNNGMLGTA
jgi:hypothetical protein